MLLNITNTNNENYLAKIVRITNLRKHPKADRLMIATIDGNDVITSSTSGIVQDSYVCYFPAGSCLSAKFLKETNSFRDKELNADPESEGGFFEKNCRIRPMKLREIPSNGYMVPISILAKYAGVEPLQFMKEEDVEFDTLNHEIFIKKYVPPVKEVRSGTGTGPKVKTLHESKLVRDQFKLHTNTPQLGKSIWAIQPDTEISVTWKMHGTSFVSSNVLVKRKLTWFERILKRLGVKISEEEYGNIYSSRKVIKNEDLNPNANHFYKTDIWGEVNKIIAPNLLKGETVYGEIVGYLPDGGMIQKGYDYKCNPSAPIPFDIYIYRITHTNVDDKVIELSHNQLAERCLQIGVKSVPLIFSGQAHQLFPVTGNVDNRNWNESFYEYLKQTYVYDQDSQFCNNSVPEEGIVLRTESLTPQAYKLKAFRFLEHESAEHDKGIRSVEDDQSETSE